MRKFLILLAFLTAFVLSETRGVSAADCGNKCCKSIRLPPFKKQTICDPGCKAICEGAKATNLPDFVIPPSAINEVVDGLQKSCAMGFEAVTKYVLIRQGSYSAGSDRLLNAAKDAVIRAGAIQPEEFNNVHVRWCQIWGHGLAPDRDTVCINEGYLRDNNLMETAITLAHEMFHIRQYRRGTTDQFKCDYARQFVECAGCQDQGLPLEAEAYAFENQVGPAIGRAVMAAMPATAYRCVTPVGECRYPNPTHVGIMCFCTGISQPGSTRE